MLMLTTYLCQCCKIRMWKLILKARTDRRQKNMKQETELLPLRISLTCLQKNPINTKLVPEKNVLILLEDSVVIVNIYVFLLAVPLTIYLSLYNFYLSHIIGQFSLSKPLTTLLMWVILSASQKKTLCVCFARHCFWETGFSFQGSDNKWENQNCFMIQVNEMKIELI